MSNNHRNVDDYAAYLYNFLHQYVPLSEADFDRFLPFLEVRMFEKKEEILKLGEVEDYLNFVVKGVARKYVVSGKNEKTLQLATEGHVIQSELSFHTRTPSTSITEALEPCVMVSMSYVNVQRALAAIPFAEEIGRKLVTYMFVKKDARYFKQLNQTTRERFLGYVTEHPHMVQRIPQRILASYLEINPETFSRMKHLLRK